MKNSTATTQYIGMDPRLGGGPFPPPPPQKKKSLYICVCVEILNFGPNIPN